MYYYHEKAVALVLRRNIVSMKRNLKCVFC